MISRTLPSAEREAVVGAGLLRGASTALLLTSLIGGTALLLELVWPWLAWGYVIALVGYLPLILAVRAMGPSGSPGHDIAILWISFTALMAITVRITRALEREVERVRQEHRSG